MNNSAAWEWHPNRVLIVDDNVDLANAYQAALQTYNYEVSKANTLATAEDLIFRFMPGFILLDVQMDTSGKLTTIPLLEKLRNPVQLPVHVIVITAQNAKYPQVQMYAAGSDQYFTKPVAIEEVVAYMRRVAEQRFGKGTAQRRIKLAEGELDLDSMTVFRQGADAGSVSIPKKVGQLIQVLLRAYPNWVSTDDERLIWPQERVEDDALRQLVLRARKALGGEQTIEASRRDGTWWRWGLEIPEEGEKKNGS